MPICAARRCRHARFARASISALPSRSCRISGAGQRGRARSPDPSGDLGLVPAVAAAGAGAWWSALEVDAAPQIIARLPFVERAGPSRPRCRCSWSRRAADDAMVTEVEVWSVRVSGWSAGGRPCAQPAGGRDRGARQRLRWRRAAGLDRRRAARIEPITGALVAGRRLGARIAPSSAATRPAIPCPPTAGPGTGG